VRICVCILFPVEMSHNNDDAASPAATSTGAFEEYMAMFTTLFGEELYRAHQSDAHVEMTAVLADCVEAGLLVWGSPLKLPQVVS
jgi:Na+-translocating ferredoxin:NAD+ oxidoreductase RnfC subunit